MKTTLIIFSLLTLVSCGAMREGKTGASGKDGTNGVNGKDGSSCHVNSVSNGAIITCDDGTQSIVMNGDKGEVGDKGETGTNGISPILETIDPCGNGTGFDEILIKTNIGYISYFEEGNKRFLAKLDIGSYRTTDQQACRFNVNADGSITW
jgi:hypothetical protein